MSTERRRRLASSAQRHEEQTHGRDDRHLSGEDPRHHRPLKGVEIVLRRQERDGLVDLGVQVFEGKFEVA